MLQTKPTIENTLVRIAHDEAGIAEAICNRIRAKKGRGKFLLCLAGTETSDVPGVSAAGKTPELRRLTPAADAECLILGRVVSVPDVPKSPSGVIAPVVITRACRGLLDWNISIIDCGTFHQPAIDTVIAGDTVAKSVSSGEALPRHNVLQLFERGVTYGAGIGTEYDYLVLSECVPGGTTTALGVLSAFGFDVDGLLSGSVPKIDHDLRSQLVAEGLKRAQLDASTARRDPFLAVQAVGDPMQAYAAGVLIGVSKTMPVILAGGSQMLAVHGLARLIAQSQGTALPNQVATFTTKWVVDDPSADVKRLSKLLQVPIVSSCPDFNRSRHEGLKAYEKGNVKEGVGAGAAIALAELNAGYSEPEIMAAIDQTYDEIALVSES